MNTTCALYSGLCPKVLNSLLHSITLFSNWWGYFGISFLSMAIGSVEQELFVRYQMFVLPDIFAWSVASMMIARGLRMLRLWCDGARYGWPSSGGDP